MTRSSDNYVSFVVAVKDNQILYRLRVHFSPSRFQSNQKQNELSIYYHHVMFRAINIWDNYRIQESSDTFRKINMTFDTDNNDVT